MAVALIQPFEFGSNIDSQNSSGTFSFSTTTVRTGTYSFRSNPTTTAVGWIRYTQASNPSTAYNRFYFRAATLPAANDEVICQAIDGSAVLKLEVRVNSSGNLVVYDSAVTLLATGTTVLSTGTWYQIEVKVGTAAGSAAAWDVRINGVSEASGTGTLLNTPQNFLMVGKAINRNGNSVDFFYDDLCVLDNAFPGSGEGRIVIPDSNGNYQTWSIGAGGGSHFQNVDDGGVNDGDTTYLLSTGTVGNAETEGLQSCATVGISGTINGVRGWIIQKRNAAGASVKVRIRSGSTDSDSAAGGNTAGYSFVNHHLTNDPATGAAWTTSGIDAAEVGAVENATTNQTRVTSCGLFVDFAPAAAGGVTFIVGGAVGGQNAFITE